MHKTLKTIYSLESEGSVTEKKVGNYIVDIERPDKSIVEIQTASLAHLSEKIKYFLDEKKQITVVYPLVTEKYIRTKKIDGTATKRKSPCKKNIYSIFQELTKLCPFLLDKNFFLEVLEVSVTEERKETDEKVQAKNGRRRFKKNWLKTGKSLNEIKCRHIFHGKKSYMALFPKNLLETFLFKDFYAALKCMEKSVKADDAHLMLWCFCRMNLVNQGEKQGRFNTYKTAGTHKQQALHD